MQVDWDAVATELGISNGHAARMRFSRFKQVMEPTASASRNASQNLASPKRRNDNNANKISKKSRMTAKNESGKETANIKKEKENDLDNKMPKKVKIEDLDEDTEMQDVQEDGQITHRTQAIKIEKNAPLASIPQMKAKPDVKIEEPDLAEASIDHTEHPSKESIQSGISAIDPRLLAESYPTISTTSTAIKDEPMLDSFGSKLSGEVIVLED